MTLLYLKLRKLQFRFQAVIATSLVKMVVSVNLTKLRSEYP